MIFKTKNIRTKKIILIISLAGNLGLLGFFKYADFAIAQFNILGQSINFGTQIPLLHLALPIAISFYTFHSITYTVSIYRGQMTPVRSFTEYAIFVAFFPQLVAGPILRAKEFLPQLREKIENFEIGSKLRQIEKDSNLKVGITLMTFGFLKKLFFADNISEIVNDVFTSTQGLESFTVILGTLSFGVQIYCDFSGYSDIALGAAMILGFKIPINFNKPYFATSPSDFWRRWHISLSTWLRDYLYVPLGGNRKGKVREYVNLFAVMLLGGLWHGASWNFVIWGALHGAYLGIHKIIRDKFPNIRGNFFNTKLGIVVSIIVTQYFVFLAWIPFRVQNTDLMLYAMKKYLFLDFQISNTIEFINSHKISILILALFMILHFISYKNRNMITKLSNLRMKYWFLFLLVTSLAIILFYNGNPVDFIYFKF